MHTDRHSFNGHSSELQMHLKMEIYAVSLLGLFSQLIVWSLISYKSGTQSGNDTECHTRSTRFHVY
jgi:hypothetical protein